MNYFDINDTGNHSRVKKGATKAMIELGISSIAPGFPGNYFWNFCLENSKTNPVEFLEE